MKKHTLILFCAAAVFALNACDSDDNSNSCNTSKDCGNTELYKCNILQHVCEARFPEHCINNQKDSGEADVDCGSICGNEKLCALNKSCTSNADCASKNCVGNKCVAATCTEDANCSAIPGAVCDVPNGVCISCTDGVKNGDETDIDCGGNCSTKCAGGKACKKGGDCENGICEAGTCSSVKVDAADPKDLVINEIFDSASSSPSFVLNGGAKCEFIEIANTSAKVVSLDGLSIELQRTDETGNGKVLSVPLSGALPAKNLLVVHSCDNEMSLPDDAIGLRPAKDDEKHTPILTITSTAIYDITITNGTSSTEKINVDISKSKNKSSLTRDPEFSATGEMKLTTDIPNAVAFATPGYCSNGGQFSKNCQVEDTCNNSQKDGAESDVDCGGAMCPKCADNKACTGDSDCASGFCDNNVCATKTCAKDSECGSGLKCNLDEGICYTPESCSDGIKNQDETDIDCGGSCSACSFGQKCLEASDCDTNKCTGNVCSGTKPDVADINKLSINEVMGSPKSGESYFATQPDTKQTEFIEIINLDSKAVSLDGIQIKLKKDGADSDTSIDLNGVIPANGVFVVSEASIPMPSDGANMIASIGMTNKTAYTLWLEKDGAKASEVTRAALSTGNGKSQNRNPDKDTANATLSWHDDVSSLKLLNSPGYCANGGKFSEGCADACSNNQKDGDESDIDCGGTKCGKCDNDKACKSENDCKSGECTEGKCTGMAVVDAKAEDILINEFMAAEDTTQSSTSFFTINGDNVKECKFIEAVNISSNKISLDACSLVAKRTDAEKQSSTKLNGALSPKGVIVAHNCADGALPLPEGTLEFKLASTTNVTQSGEYELYVECNAQEGEHLTAAKATKGTSMNLSQDLNASNKAMIPHTEVPGNAAVASPGYCANGALFTNDCAL